MTLTSISTPSIWPMAATICLMLILAAYSWLQRDVPGALPFMIGCLFTFLVTIGLFSSSLAIDPGSQTFWLRFEFSWMLPAATAITCFVLEYAWPGRWLTRRNLALLSILPLFYIFYFMGGGYTLFGPDPFQASASISPLSNPASLLFTIYALFLTLVNLTVFAWLFIRSPQHRWPVALMASSAIFILTGILREIPSQKGQDLSFPLFVLPILIYAIALYGFRIFDPIPMARQIAIEQMQAGLLVLDLQDRVITMNPAAERIIAQTSGQARGQRIQNLLPGYPDDRSENQDQNEFEISLPVPNDQKLKDGRRYFTLTISQIKDFRGHHVGRLLLLQDVTRRKQAETALDESREIQRLIFENASEGIAIYEEYPDQKTRKLIACNQRYAELSGYSKADLLAVGDTMVIQKPLAPVPYASPRSEIADAQSEGFFSWLRPDGKENTIEYKSETIQLGGRLLSIGLDRDATERKRAEAKILEQQRALATQNERERMARELHDSLGQVLSYASLQVETAAQLSLEGQGEAAAAQLNRLGSVVRDAHADLREYILNLHSTASLEQPFFPAVKQYLDGFTRNYDIQTLLEVEPGLDQSAFSPDRKLQLFRILQEAASNARKHGRAHQVQVSFRVVEGGLRMAIQDDGCGFQLEEVADPSGGGHYGLLFMRERAEALGGTLRITSAPGAGTQVAIILPNKEG